MKRLIVSATNTAGMPAKPEIIEAAETDEAQAAFQDKVSDAKDDFDYIIAGLDQLDMVQANEIINKLHENFDELIQEIAATLA